VAIGSPTVWGTGLRCIGKEWLTGVALPTMTAGRYGGYGSRFTGRGGAWYPSGARGVGCLTGGGPEATIHGELHAEDEAAGAIGGTVVQAGGFSCRW
jgi:hypothetical protein